MVLAHDDPGRVLSREHRREVEHGHVGLAVVVDRELQVRHLVLGREVRGLSGVVLELLRVHIVRMQQLGGVTAVLDCENEKKKQLNYKKINFTHIQLDIWIYG